MRNRCITQSARIAIFVLLATVLDANLPTVSVRANPLLRGIALRGYCGDGRKLHHEACDPGLSATCGPDCTETGSLLDCTSDADCPTGQACGEDNATAYGEPASASVCWPALCEDKASQRASCGRTDAPCGICPLELPCGADHCALFTATCAAGQADSCAASCGTQSDCAALASSCASAQLCQPECGCHLRCAEYAPIYAACKAGCATCVRKGTPECPACPPQAITDCEVCGEAWHEDPGCPAIGSRCVAWEEVCAQPPNCVQPPQGNCVPTEEACDPAELASQCARCLEDTETCVAGGAGDEACTMGTCDPRSGACTCETSTDCASGLVCGTGNGARFGLASNARTCWNPRCEQLSPDASLCGSNAAACGTCVLPAPDCAGRACGDDGQGGSCGQAPAGAYCTASGQVVPASVIEADGAGNSSFSIHLPMSDAQLPMPVQQAEQIAAGITTEAAGTLDGTLAVTPSGAVEYRVPLAVPPGRAGIEPRLELVYSSHGGPGLLGHGWRLDGLSSISLCHQTVGRDGKVSAVASTGAERRFCLDGKRLVTEDASAVHGAPGVHYRTEVDAFVRVTSHGAGPDFFEARTRDGRIFTFAHQVHAGMGPDGSGPLILTWALSRVTDRVGNALQVEYAYRTDEVSSGFTREYSPTVIRYAGFGTEPGSAEVVFHYAARSDPRQGFVGGTLLQKTRLLTAIETRVESRTVRKYKLSYEQAPGWLETSPARDENASMRPSLLTALEECAQAADSGPSHEDSALTCKRPTRLCYEGAATEFCPQTSVQAMERQSSISGYPQGADSDGNFPRHTVVDLNGNGIDDIVMDTTSTYWVLLDSQQFVDTGVSVASGELFVLDYDLDGRDDLLERSAAHPRRNVAPGQAGPLRALIWDDSNDTFEASATSIQDPVASTALPRDSKGRPPQSGLYVVDIDGDGLHDVVACRPAAPGIYEWALFRRRADATFVPGGYQPRDVPCRDAYALDLEGNGSYELLIRAPHEADILRHGGYGDIGSGTYAVLYDDGSENGAMERIDLTYSSTDHYLPMDLNGDRLVDLLRLRLTFDSASEPSGYTSEFWINTGRGVSASGPAFLSHGGGGDAANALVSADLRTDQYLYDPLAGFRRMIVHDANRDGRDDIVSWVNEADPEETLLEQVTLISDGLELRTEGFSSIGVPGREMQGFISAHTTYDANGDGLTDIGLVERDGEDRRWVWYKANGPGQPRLTTVTDGRGAVTEVAYGSTQDPGVYTHMPSACSYPLACPHPRATLAHRVTSRSAASSGEPHVVEYSYAGNVDALDGEGGLGFRVFQAHDRTRDVVTTQAMDRVEHRDPVTGVHPYAGVPTIRSVSSVTASGDTYLDVERDYFDLDGVPCTEGWASRTALPPNVCLSTKVITEAGEVLSSQTTRAAYDAYGNATSRRTEWTDGELLLQETSFQHAADARYRDHWLVALPLAVVSTSTGAGGGPAASQRYFYQYYDAPGSCSPPAAPGAGALTGLVRQIARVHDTAMGAQTRSYCWNERGNLTRETLAGEVRPGVTQERYTDYAYDTREIFVVEAQDVNGRSTLFDTHPGTGARRAQLRQLQPGANAWIATATVHDGFGRPRAFVHDDASVDFVFHGAGPNGIGEVIDGSGEGVADPSLSLDAWGRASAFATDAFGGRLGNVHEYDAAGREIRYTRARRIGTTPDIPTTITYDALDRPLQITPPLGIEAIENCYHRRVACTKSAIGHVQCRRMNQRGQTIAVTRPTLGTNGTCLAEAQRVWSESDPGDVSYSYGAFGRMISAQTAVGVRTLTYDEYGRPLSINDPDAGPSTFQYNSFDEVWQTVDGQGRLAQHEYDALGRLTARINRSSPTANDPVVTSFVYDEGIVYGALTRAVSPDGVEISLEYDSLGRLSGRTLQTPEATRTLAITYDGRSRPAQITYPGGSGLSALVVERMYDPTSGVLERVRDPSSDYTFWSRLEANDFGQTTREQLGPAITFSQSYDDLTGRVRSVAAAGLLGFDYAYDIGGALESQIDQVGPLGYRQFSYDHYRRLEAVSVTAGASTGQAVFGYDSAGRLVSKSASGATFETELLSYTYAPGTHRVAGVSAMGSGVQSYTYNDSGALQSRTGSWQGDLTFEFASHTGDLPSYMESGGEGIAMRYDAFGTRTNKLAPDRSTFYFDDALYELTDVSGALEQHILLSSYDAVVAEVVRRPGAPNEILYHLRDRLGSSSVIASENGALLERRDYDVWGRRPGLATNASLVDFTGHARDAETGLIDMGARLYDPLLARALSPDPLLTNVWNPLDHDAYAYARSNPLAYTDPTGACLSSSGAGGGPTLGTGGSDVQCSNGGVGVPLPVAVVGAIAGGVYLIIKHWPDIVGWFQGLFEKAPEPPRARRIEGQHVGGTAKSHANGPARAPIGDRADTPLESAGGATRQVVGPTIEDGEMYRNAKGVPDAVFSEDELKDEQQNARVWDSAHNAVVFSFPGGSVLGITARSARAVAASRAVAIRPVGALLGTVDDVLVNPKLLSKLNPADLLARIGGRVPNGWRVETLGQGAHKGQGFVLRQYTARGEATGRQIRWHPGGGHHGPKPYWRVNNGTKNSEIIEAARWQ